MSNFEESPEDIKLLSKEWPLCFELELKPNDIVIVAGAYQGKVMELLARIYPELTIHGFDPQLWAIERAAERLENVSMDSTWYLHNYGIGIKEGTFPMDEWGTDGCSFVSQDRREKGVGQLREFGKVMEDLEIERINLAIFNMEGYEFPLLTHLLAECWIEKIDKLAVQWHVNLGAGGMSDVDSTVRSIMNHGHKLIWDHRPQWTYFKQ